uniref:Uncharacterized protein n=1 Tax=Timema bartmani TaxID=61472 RepID=A0A7R9I7P0_9NEOP|nr:unnamed protein product [Timema bartmani]
MEENMWKQFYEQIQDSETNVKTEHEISHLLESNLVPLQGVRVSVEPRQSVNVKRLCSDVSVRKVTAVNDVTQSAVGRLHALSSSMWEHKLQNTSELFNFNDTRITRPMAKQRWRNIAHRKYGFEAWTIC